MLSRRDLVGKLAAGAAAACAVGVARTSLASPRAESTTPGDRQQPSGASQAAAVEPEVSPAVVEAAPSLPPPWELVQPLTAGAEVAHGWHVAGLTGVVNGSCVLTLRNARGREHRVHVCRNDGSPQGLVYTEQMDLVVMNGGQGDLPTDEGLAQAVATVAHVVAANERRHAGVVLALLPQAERVQRFAAAAGLR